MQNRKRWWQGLFARVTLAYAIGSLLLSATVAFATFTIAQNRLLSVERNRAENQFIVNVERVRPALEDIDVESNLEEREAEYRVTLTERVNRFRSRRLLSTPSAGSQGNLGPDEIPADLRETVLDENKGKFLFEDGDGDLQYAIGISLQNLNSGTYRYYEMHEFTELASTLQLLRLILFGVATLASFAGAGLGYYSARRALAPLGDVSRAAQAIASGDFKTRLDMSADRDLALLSSSFNDMVDALSTRIERDERFASDVSHELRSPLMTLTASLEILERRRSSLPEVVQQAVGLLRQDLTRFENLVEDLLEISRLDAGAVELQTSDFLLSEFMLNVIAQSRSPEIELIFDPADEDLILSADKRRLAQVITNLIDNAKKYGGGATGITFKQIGDCVQIVVEDDGPGIALVDRKRVFERFSRADADAGRRGTDMGVGLGLSLVAEHVRLHDGRVWVTDRDGGQPGAKFVVELPARIPDAVPEEMAI